MEEAVEDDNYFSTNEAEEPTETIENMESDTEFWHEIEDIVNITVLYRCNVVMRRLNMPLCSKESMRINIEFGIIIVASFSCSLVHLLATKQINIVSNEWMQ